MKKTALILITGIVLSMIIGMIQCKKKDVVAEKNYITLKLDTLKVYKIDGTQIKYEWKRGDQLWTMSDGKFVGALVYNDKSDEFKGVIGPGNIIPEQVNGNPVEGKHLCFVYTENIFPENMKIDISYQWDNVPVFFCGTSKEKYSADRYDYTGSLENKYTTVRFTMDEWSPHNVRVSNMITKADFYVDNDTIHIRPDKSSNGYILTNNPTGDNSNVRLAALLPQDEVNNADFVDGNTYYHARSGGVCVATTKDTAYLEARIDKAGTQESQIEPYFSVSKTRIVNIASGNLQYKAKDNEGYRFAEKQWHYVGGNTSNAEWGNVWNHLGNDSIKSSNDSIGMDGYDGWIDLFGWGTGYTPTEHDTINASYSDFEEWGNKIGDKKWYTLSGDEWKYLLNIDGENTVRKGKNVYTTVEGVKGILIFPDCFEMSFNGTNPEWSDMEKAGAMFLPAAGWRYYNVYKLEKDFPQMYYWSMSNPDDSYSIAYCVYNSKIDKFKRSSGCAVRLVRDVEWPKHPPVPW